MLMQIYRRIIFIHDKYILASIFNSSFIHNLITYVATPRKDPRILQSLQTYLEITGDRELARLLDEEFFKKVERISSEDLLRDLGSVLEKIKVSPSIEYLVRATSRSVFEKLVRRGFAWFIPFNSIVHVSRRRVEGKDVLEIMYMCPFTNETRYFRTIYDDKVYELIKELCRFNGNSRCG